MSDARWIVHTKGGACRAPFEIAVLREDNRHGFVSHGWFGPDKLLISHSGGPCRDAVTLEVWRELVGVAERIAASLNAGMRAVDPVQAERERCAAIADDEARIREEAGQKHVEGSMARERCFAGARAAANVAKGIRSGEVVAGGGRPVLPHHIGTIFSDGYWNLNVDLRDPMEVEPGWRNRGQARVYTEDQVHDLLRSHGVDSVDGAQRLVAECAPFLKEGETPAECITRNRKDAETAIRCYYNDAHRYAALRAMWLDREGSTFATMEMCRAETAEEFDKAIDAARGADGVDSVDGGKQR